jgi:hypothetical protein
MARPYGEPVEVITEPVPARSPFIPLDAKMAVGVVGPSVPDAKPIVLLPGFEYRMSEGRLPSTATTSSPAEASTDRQPDSVRPTQAVGAHRTTVVPPEATSIATDRGC